MARNFESLAYGGAYDKDIAQEAYYRGAIAPAPSSDFAPEVDERKITKSASLSAEVKRGLFTEADSQVKAIIKSSNSYLLSENSNKYGRGLGQYRVGSYQIKVEQEKYTQIMDWVAQYPEANWPADLSKLTLEQAVAIAGARPIIKTTNLPTSYEEWTLAGGLKGTGKTYAEWLGGGGNKTFTRTQINSGATNANIAINDFVSLPTDVQNYYIQNNKTTYTDKNGVDQSITFAEWVNGQLADVVDEKSKTDVLSAIDTSGFPSTVTDWLKQKVNAVQITISPTTKRWWEFWK